jgi:O-succinylbenzoic acid--CoA ligase
MSHDSFDLGRTVRRNPEALAVVTSGGEYWSYDRLGHEVCGAMARLVVQGVGPGSYVAVTPRRDLESLVRLHAIVEMGAAVVLLHPAWQPEERRRALAQIPGQVHDVGDWSWEASETSLPMRRALSEELPMSIAFTSGTTGQSRGTLATRGAWAAASAASEANLGWQERDSWLLAMPPAHVGGFGVVLRCLSAGKTVALFDSDAATGAALAAFIEEAEVTIASMVPTMLYRVLQHSVSWRSPESLRALLLGGAGCSEEMLQQALLRGLPLRATYGLTESCGQVTTEGECRAVGSLGSAGKALPGWDVDIREGGIWIRGSALFSAYFADGQRVQPQVGDDGYWRTGDAGALDSGGRLWVRGRDLDLIISGEAPGVLEVAVVGEADPEWGQRIAAYVVLDPSSGGLDALKAWSESRLAPFRRPRVWRVVSEIPKTRSGKMRRSVLRGNSAPQPND